jgi:hypothetical protein
VQASIVINIIFGLVLGLAMRGAAKLRFPLAFTLIVLTWNLILTGILDFTSHNREGVERLYDLGMMPGRFVSHLLFAHQILGAGLILYTIILLSNVATSLLITVLYRRMRGFLRTATRESQL